MSENFFDQAEEVIKAWEISGSQTAPILRDFMAGKAMGALEIIKLEKVAARLPDPFMSIRVIWNIRLESLLQGLYAHLSARLDAIEAKLGTDAETEEEVPPCNHDWEDVPAIKAELALLFKGHAHRCKKCHQREWVAE